VEFGERWEERNLDTFTEPGINPDYAGSSECFCSGEFQPRMGSGGMIYEAESAFGYEQRWDSLQILAAWTSFLEEALSGSRPLIRYFRQLVMAFAQV
jgi:hypothetical protein